MLRRPKAAPKAAKQQKQQTPTKVTKKKASKKVLKTAKRSKSNSILQCLTGKSNMKPVDFNTRYPGVPAPEDISETLVQPGTTQTAVLKNGIKVITSPSQNPVSHIAISFDAGSRYENQAENQQGLTNFMERAMLRSTTNRVTNVLFRDMAKLGANIQSRSSRENLMLTASTPTRINPVLGALADVIKAPAYDFVDVREDMHYYIQDIHLRQHNDHASLMDEVIHQAAFGNVGLGQSMFMSEHGLQLLQPSHLKNWHNSFLVAKRMTIAAIGVDHDSFVRLADEMLGGIATETVKIENEGTEYYGGNLRLQDNHYHGPSHVSFAWNAPSLKSKDILTTNLLQTILGGSHPSARLNSLKNAQSSEAFLSTYSDSGLIGVYGVVDSNGVGAYAENVLTEVAGLSDTVTDEQVSKAKKALSTQFLSTALGNPEAMAQDMARQIQVFGEYRTPKLLQEIENISTADVKKVAKAIFRNPEQPITVATLGDVSQLPRDISIE